MNVWSLVIQVIFSGTVIGVLTYLVKKYLEKRIENDFSQKLEGIKFQNTKEIERVKASLDIAKASSGRIVDAQINYYQELGDAIYRLRNILRDIRDSYSQPQTHSTSEELEQTFCEHVNGLKELLFKSRIVVSAEAFEVCHKFKSEAVKNAMALDVICSSDQDDTSSNFDLLIDYGSFDELHHKAIQVLRREIG